MSVHLNMVRELTPISKSSAADQRLSIESVGLRNRCDVRSRSPMRIHRARIGNRRDRGRGETVGIQCRNGAGLVTPHGACQGNLMTDAYNPIDLATVSRWRSLAPKASSAAFALREYSCMLCSLVNPIAPWHWCPRAHTLL